MSHASHKVTKTSVHCCWLLGCCCRNFFPVCCRIHPSSSPDSASVSATCARSKVTLVCYTQPSHPHLRASMLLTAAPPQTQTSSDWTGSPSPQSLHYRCYILIFPPLHLILIHLSHFSLRSPAASTLSLSFFRSTFQLLSLFQWCWSHTTVVTFHHNNTVLTHRRGGIDLRERETLGIKVWQRSVSHTMTPFHTFPPSFPSLSFSPLFTPALSFVLNQ